MGCKSASYPEYRIYFGKDPGGATRLLAEDNLARENGGAFVLKMKAPR